uniref:Putative ovule protein n=1 Tax=Solanum chacoense TaxID=4108 RepID=A0A0V0GVW9_SOLCH
MVHLKVIMTLASSINFCVRNFSGDITGAKGVRIHNTSNVVAEARVLIMESNSLSMVNILN